MRRVVVYGTVCLDRFLLPGQSETDATEFPGGEAFNTATALAGWGVPVTLTGTAVGDDTEGLRLRELLRSHPLAQGIDLSLVPFVAGAVTPVCTIRVDEHGERFMSGRGFKDVTAPKLETILPQVADCPIFTVDPNLGGAAIQATLAAAKSGCHIVSMDCAHLPEILAVSDVAVTSKEWIARIEQDMTIEMAADHMIRAGAKVAIITNGANGITMHRRTYEAVKWYPIVLPTAPIIDTTGAGDTFRAGLCFPMDDIQMSIRFAHAAAVLHCTTIGGGSRHSTDEVLGLMNAEIG